MSANIRPLADIPPTLDTRQRGTLLQIYQWYRIVVALVLLGLFFSEYTWNQSKSFQGQLFVTSTAAYCVFNLISLVMHGLSQFRVSNRQLFAIIAVDILALGVVTYASGGLSSGLASLMLIPVAAGAIFFFGRIATLIAAIASVALIAQVLYAAAQKQIGGSDFLNAGLLGILLFATSLLVQYLARRIRSSQLIAEQQSATAAGLEQLNQIIIQRMRTGIIVVGENGVIKMMNAAAARLADIDHKAAQAQHLLTGPLRDRLNRWKQNPSTRTSAFRSASSALEIQANFTSLDYGNAGPVDTLAFLEDTSVVAQKAQQLKLASLGRLTASIAHEIRNPLGAISHAAQLLRESEHLGTADKRLSEIIYNHSRRVNTIIENILQLSRRQAARPERIQLNFWLRDFCEQLLHSHPDADIMIEQRRDDIYASFDTGQLGQVMTNICENGLRHSQSATGKAWLLVRIDFIDNESPIIDVIDKGEGIPVDVQERIFEPFFTTEKSGTGLGLFLSREMCEANQARLDYRTDAEGRTCFRVSFAHPDKIIDFAPGMDATSIDASNIDIANNATATSTDETLD